MLALKTLIKPLSTGLLILCGLQLCAQSPNVHFDRITINEGLSLSSVYCIYQDSKGFMWFGTEDGLNKYDGANFTIYSHTPGEENSLSHKWIEQISEDSEGMIWLGSHQGLTRLDPKTDEMMQFRSTSDASTKLSNDTIISLLASGNYIWAGTQNGLNRIDIKSLAVDHYFPGQAGTNCRVNEIHKDHYGRLWIGSSCGLYVNLPGYDNVVSVVRDNNIDVLSIESMQDSLWIGTRDGLYMYILEDELPVSFRYPAIRKASSNPISNLYYDSKSRLWIQTREGLFLYLNDKKLVRVIHAPELSPSLSVNPVKPLLEDNSGNLWYGTFASGIYELNANGKLRNYSHNAANPFSLSDNTVNCIFQDRSGAV